MHMQKPANCQFSSRVSFPRQKNFQVCGGLQRQKRLKISRKWSNRFDVVPQKSQVAREVTEWAVARDRRQKCQPTKLASSCEENRQVLQAIVRNCFSSHQHKIFPELRQTFSLALCRLDNLHRFREWKALNYSHLSERGAFKRWTSCYHRARLLSISIRGQIHRKIAFYLTILVLRMVDRLVKIHSNLCKTHRCLVRKSKYLTLIQRYLPHEELLIIYFAFLKYF